MNWKVDTITDRDSRKLRPETGPPIRMTLVEGGLERGKTNSDGVDITHLESEIASSLMAAIQATREHGTLQGRPSERPTRDFPVDLLPLHEVIARVRDALTRDDVSSKEEAQFCVGDLHLDASRYLVRKRGRPLHLTPKEFALLHNLMMNAGTPVPHRTLLRLMWGSRYGGERECLRVIVRQLRVKIEDNPANPKYLLTEPGIGYRLAESVEDDSVISLSD